MTAFTYTLPDELFIKLKDTSKDLSLPINKIIDKALLIYLDQLKRTEYVKSYKLASQDEDILVMAEEGMSDYLTQLYK